jgi:regulator of cell morphogenesis and NO signaling
MGSPKITGDMVINDVIRQYPATIAVFNAFRVDSCCGGGQSIERTSGADGVDVTSLLAALNAAVGGEGE